MVNKGRAVNKKVLARRHRKQAYIDTLQAYMDGKCSLEKVRERLAKWKEIK
jgi:hypothetical protein